MILFFDTETTGFVDKNLPLADERQPNLVQFAGILADLDGRVVRSISSMIRPYGIYTSIPAEASQVHGVTTKSAERWGVDLRSILDWYCSGLVDSDLVVCHNVDFDLEIMKIQLVRSKMAIPDGLNTFCTMKISTNLCKIVNPKYPGKYKWPKLQELHEFLFGERFKGAHDALEDVRATMRCYFRLCENERDKWERLPGKELNNEVERL